MFILRFVGVFGLVCLALLVVAYLATGNTRFRQAAIQTALFLVVLLILVIGLLVMEQLLVPLL